MGFQKRINKIPISDFIRGKTRPILPLILSIISPGIAKPWKAVLLLVELVENFAPGLKMIFKITFYFEFIKFCTIKLFIMRNICVQKIWWKLQFYFFRTHLASDFTPNFCHHIFRLLTIFLRVLDSVYVPKMKGISQKPRGVEQNIHVVSCNF